MVDTDVDSEHFMDEELTACHLEVERDLAEIEKLEKSAPDLLAALKQCVIVLNPGAIVMDAHKRMVWEDAKSTIKKATS